MELIDNRLAIDVLGVQVGCQTFGPIIAIAINMPYLLNSVYFRIGGWPDRYRSHKYFHCGSITKANGVLDCIIPRTLRVRNSIHGAAPFGRGKVRVT